MANLIGEAFQKYVNDQIRVRQNTHGKKNRTTKELQYLNTRNAWVKMASAVHITQDRLDLLDNYQEVQNGKIVTKGRNNQLLRGIYPGKNLALKNVLFGGLTSFGSILKNKETNDNEEEHFGKKFRSGIEGKPYNRAYGVGGTDQFGYSPMPGIIDMDMKCLNRGSIKKIQLNIKCHNRSQFDIIDVLYLRLGYSVFIEWGYDKYLNNDGDLINMGSTLIDKEFWLDKYDKSDYTQWIPMIEKNRNTHNGNYDGIFGTVSNFSWTFENDGTYNIKVDIISLGDIIESLKVNLPSVYMSNGNSFYGKKFAQLLENTTGGIENQETFYGQMFPGLKASIKDWYDRCKIGWDNMSSIPLERLNYKNPPGDLGRNLPTFSLNYALARSGNQFSDWFSKCDDSLGDDHQFYDLSKGGNIPYTNSEIVSITGDPNYKMSQKEIREAITYAVVAWFFWKWDVPKLGSQEVQDKDAVWSLRYFKWNWSLNTPNGRFAKNWNEKGIKHVGNWYTIKASPSFEDNTDYNASLMKLRKTYYPFPYFENGEKTIGFFYHKQMQTKGGSSTVWYDFRTQDQGDNTATQNWLKKGYEYPEYRTVGGSRGVFNTKYATLQSKDRWKTILESSWTKSDFDSNTYIIESTGEGGTMSEYFSNVDNITTDPVKNGINLDWILEHVYKYFTKSKQTYGSGQGAGYRRIPGYAYDFMSPSSINYDAVGVMKAKSIPPSEESKQLSEQEKLKKQLEASSQSETAQENENAAARIQKQQEEVDKEIARLQAIRDQQISDFKNQNKNRIYRYFYNIRDAIKTANEKGKFKFGDDSLSLDGATLQDMGDIYFPGNPNEKVGEILSYVEDKEPIEVMSGILEATYAFSTDLGEAANDNNVGEVEKVSKEFQQALIQAVEGEENAKNHLNIFKLSDPDQQNYIRLGSFLNWLQTKVIPKIQRTKNVLGVPMIRIDTHIDQNICYVIDNVVSLDIRKLILSNPSFINGLTDTNDENTANPVPIFPDIDPFVKSLPHNSNLKYGQIMNLYFSFERLQEIFDSTTSKSDVFLFGALKEICNDINDCLGNINNIEPIVDENNIIHFVDQTTIPGIDEIAKSIGLKDFTPRYTPEPLIVYGYNGRKSNFVRNIGLTTEISKEYATMITIGATSNGAIPGIEATAFSRWNTGIKDRFKNNITDATDSTVQEPLKTEAGKEVQNNYATLLSETLADNKGFGLFGLNKEKSTYFTINEDDIEFNRGIVEDFYKLMQAQNSYKDETDTQGNTIESSVGFLPFNLKITLDGISGIKIYNKLTIQQSFLPSNYPESLDFVVTQVNHKLSNNDWVTELETIATSKSVLTNKKKKAKRK